MSAGPEHTGNGAPWGHFGHGLAVLLDILHYTLIPYALLAWVWPEPVWLIVHLIFIPGLMMQWWLNQNTCVLSNMASWLRRGLWWDPADRHQGSWAASVLEFLFRHPFSPRAAAIATYGLLAASWGLSAWRLATS